MYDYNHWIFFIGWRLWFSRSFKKKYIGKTWDLKHLNSLNDSGQHSQVMKSFDIGYDYSIDQNAKTITLDGTMKYNKTSDESKYHSETVLLEVKFCEVRVFFADATGKILNVEVFFTGHGQNIFDPIEFNESLPFSDQYKYMSLGYNVYWEG